MAHQLRTTFAACAPEGMELVSADADAACVRVRGAELTVNNPLGSDGSGPLLFADDDAGGLASLAERVQERLDREKHPGFETVLQLLSDALASKRQRLDPAAPELEADELQDQDDDEQSDEQSDAVDSSDVDDDDAAYDRAPDRSLCAAALPLQPPVSYASCPRPRQLCSKAVRTSGSQLQSSPTRRSHGSPTKSPSHRSTSCRRKKGSRASCRRCRFVHSPAGFPTRRTPFFSRATGTRAAEPSLRGRRSGVPSPSTPTTAS